MKARTSATEFIRWQKYLDDDINAFHREDWYMARIAYEVYLCKFMLGGKPTIEFKDFLMEFTTADKDVNTEERQRSPEEEAEWVAYNKSRWLAAAGLDPATGKPIDGMIVNPGRADPGKVIQGLPNPNYGLLRD